MKYYKAVSLKVKNTFGCAYKRNFNDEDANKMVTLYPMNKHGVRRNMNNGVDRRLSEITEIFVW